MRVAKHEAGGAPPAVVTAFVTAVRDDHTSTVDHVELRTPLVCHPERTTTVRLKLDGEIVGTE